MRNRFILAMLAASVAVPASAQIVEAEPTLSVDPGVSRSAEAQSEPAARRAPIEIAQREGRRGGGGQRGAWSGGAGRRGGGEANRTAPRSTNEAVFRARERAVPSSMSAQPRGADREARRDFRQERRGDRQEFRQERRDDRQGFRQERRDWRQDRPTNPADRGEWRREGRQDQRDFRQDRRDDRRDFRQDRRGDRQDFRGDNGRLDRDNRGWNNDRRFNDNRRWNDGRGWNGGDRNNGNWNRGWRNDRRYDWQRYRQSNRGLFRGSRYYAPRGWGYGYQRFGIGISLFSGLYASNYWINDPWAYRLPPAYGSYRWVRYYDDALLVDVRSGYVVDVIHDFFW